MPTVLDDIVARKRVEIAGAKAATPLEAVKASAAGMAPARDFFAALRPADGNVGTKVIAEVKRMSPSAGVIRADFDAADIAKRYEKAGASAISCLTDAHYFGGDLASIAQIKQAVDLPVLRKDFLIDAYQVWEARAAGADAILLIAEILFDSELAKLMHLAHHLNMTTLVEVHDRENLLRAAPMLDAAAGRSLLGINNRDLRTMTTDLAHTFRMVDMVEDRSIIVSESGIRTAEDLAKLRRHDVRTVLVGEHLMKQDDPGAALGAMLAPPESN